jgi:hypothetical protein
MKGVLVLSLLLFLTVFRAPAQEAARPDSGSESGTTGQLAIQADVDSALVIIDSVKVGQSPLVVKDLKPGFHRLKIVHPDVTNWLTSSILDSVQLQPGEEKTLRYTFGRRYLILSVPSGADVIIGDSLAGPTPFLLTLPSSDSFPAITLRRAGYDSALVDLSRAQRGTQTIALKKVWSPDQRGEEVDESGVGQGSETFRVYLAGAITVGFGAAAAYFKIQADERNTQYLESYSSSSLSQVHVYDTASAICLVFAEVGFGFLTYYLLAE